MTSWKYNVAHPKKLYTTHLSLCAGYGGIDLGLRNIFPDLYTTAYCEIELYAIQVLLKRMEEKHLDPAPIYTNLKTFPWISFRGSLSILSGGFPCQPFSNAGKQEGVEDPRHLYPYISEGIQQSQPAVIFLENVLGIISTKTKEGESVLHYVLKDLEQLGYRATAGVFSASEIGAPHQRKRVFILGATKKMADTDNNRYRQDTTRQEKKGGVSQEHWQEVCGGMPHRTSQQHNSELADSTDIRCGGRSNRNGAIGSGLQIEETQVGSMVRSQASGCSRNSGELADSHSSGGRQDRWQSELRAEGIEQSSCNQGGARERQAPEGQEGQQKAVGRVRSHQWPSRPNEPQYAWEESRVIQAKSKLGGAAHGSASGVDPAMNHTDRLRILGNGVCPQTAELAFRVLSQRLLDGYRT